MSWVWSQIIQRKGFLNKSEKENCSGLVPHFSICKLLHFAQLCFVHQRSKNHPVFSNVFFPIFFSLRDDSGQMFVKTVWSKFSQGQRSSWIRKRIADWVNQVTQVASILPFRFGEYKIFAICLALLKVAEGGLIVPRCYPTPTLGASQASTARSILIARLQDW